MEPDVLNEFYQRYQRELYLYLLVLCGRQALADIPMELRMNQEQAEAHFLSLLAYVGDHPAFFSGIMDGTPVFEREQLDHTANYVKEHGLWLDGFYFEGSKAEVMALEGEDMVYRIVTCPAE